jgi:LmbE family N-acetylglucosaminyl deacetylase
VNTPEKGLLEMPTSTFPERTILVMAHPDDEILWASSVLSEMEQIVFCFGDVASQPVWSVGRRRSLEEYPLPNMTSLGFPESEVFDGAAWPDPVETEYGLAVRQGPRSSPEFSESRYRQAHPRLISALRPFVEGKSAVITHSPWGEYGHEEHVQVFRAVADLQAEMGFSLWVPGYASNKSYPLMLRQLSRLDRSLKPLPTDPELASRLQALYTRNGCWTWFEDYVWPRQEYFYRWRGPDEEPLWPRSGSVVEMHMLWAKWRPPQHRPLLRRLLRRGGRLLHRR